MVTQMELKKNDLVEVTIHDYGTDGEGIGRYEGITLFIKDAIVGDTVQARITKVKKSYAYARVEQIMEPSSYRTEPICRFHRQCGGCQIQAMQYEKQLEFKAERVRNNLQRIGGFSQELLEQVMEPVIGMEEPFHYRNKAQFPFGTNKEGEVITGFYAGRTHNIIANTDCALGVAENQVILEKVLAYMKEYHVKAYDEKTGKGLLRHVLIRKGFTSGELMVCLIINGKKLPNEENLVKSLITVPGMKSITVNTNLEKTNVIMGKELRTLWGETTICDSIDGITFRISPLSFYQVNPIQTSRLYRQALAYADLHGEETVWDLYCGIGTISLFLAQKAKKVYGVEIIPEAIADARENAALNHMDNTEFYVGKAEEVLPRLYEEKGIYADVIVVDPPRKGCDLDCLNTMLKMQPKRIVYVSCDSATLARDLKILCEGGYELKKVRPVDMFPQTTHVETVVLLSKGIVNSRKVKVDFSLEDMDLSEFKGKATYEQIKTYVLEQTGLKVSSLYIAQIKKKCGLDVGENFNLPKSENAKQPQCTPEKEEAIMQAFKHFGIV